MAEEVSETETVIQCIVFFYGEGDRIDNPRKKHKFRVKVLQGEKNLEKFKERIW